MPVTLGSYTFSEPLTAVAEALEEIGGRDARQIRLQGMLAQFETPEALEAEFDALLAAASASEAVALSLRTGRQFFVRRTGFKRELSRDPLVGAFTLQLEALPAYEETQAETVVTWYFAASGATRNFTTAGNLATVPALELQAAGVLVNPSVSDGARTLSYDGTLAAGAVLLCDSAAGVVTLDGEDVTPYTSGVFPQIAPAGTVFTYTDAPDSSHAGILIVRYRDRWW
ncbi:MAG: hypothetical protein HYZ00_09365 [Candidatus Hydrogenedentes bacterium]|nr:hypothetical protein [Candidatus Hydrogenedentota bacterium]